MLHILSKTPIDRVILERTVADDIILLLEDAVIDALDSGSYRQYWTDNQMQQKIFILAADLEIRGISTESVVTGIHIIDYQGFVQLIIDNEVNFSWH